MPVAFSFEKFKDPAFLAEIEQEREERERLIRQIQEWREITVGATGHRPEKMGGFADALGGYKRDGPLVVKLRETTLNVLEDLIANKKMSRFVSGGALGFDSLFFWCVNHLKKKYPHIQNVLAIPFTNQDKKWSTHQKYWYKRMLETADEVIDVARHPLYSTYQDMGKNPIHLDDYSAEKMKKRNEFISDQSKYLLAFYDGSKGGTFHCIHYAMRSFNRPTIIVLDPRFGLVPEYL